MDNKSTADTAAEDHGVPLTESQRIKRESLADLIPPPPEEDEADQGT